MKTNRPVSDKETNFLCQYGPEGLNVHRQRGKCSQALGVLFILLLLSGCADPVWAETASYYTVESCLKESGQYKMANGRLLNDNLYTCASWDYPFGSILRVTNLDNGKSVEVVVTDRGPAKRLVRTGRIIDLSRGAFERLASLSKGIIKIRIESVVAGALKSKATKRDKSTSTTGRS